MNYMPVDYCAKNKSNAQPLIEGASMQSCQNKKKRKQNFYSKIMSRKFFQKWSVEIKMQIIESFYIFTDKKSTET